jgi:hypothetical protein
MLEENRDNSREMWRGSFHGTYFFGLIIVSLPPQKYEGVMMFSLDTEAGRLVVILLEGTDT